MFTGGDSEGYSENHFYSITFGYLETKLTVVEEKLFRMTPWITAFFKQDTYHDDGHRIGPFEERSLEHIQIHCVADYRDTLDVIVLASQDIQDVYNKEF